MSASEQSDGSGHDANSSSGGSLANNLPDLAGALPYAADPGVTLELLETIIASMSEAVVVAEGKTVLHNPASLALHGFEKGTKALNMAGGVASIWQISDLAGNPLPVSAWPLTRALRGEQFNGYEVRVRRTDTGRQFVGSYSGTAIRDESGAVRYALITIRDVSKQKEAEERVRESENRFRSVLERSLDAAYRRDLQHDRYDYLSPVIEQITGFSPEEMSAMTMRELWTRIHPDDHQLVREGMARAETSGKEVIEYRFRRKDGVYRWLADSFSIVIAADGHPRYRGGTIRDITERKQAEQALRESEQQFTTMANSIPQLAWITDAEGWIYWYNQRWYDYTGTTLEEVEGWGWQKVHHPDHVDRVVSRMSEAFEKGEPWEDTFPMRGKDGEYRWFLSRALPIRDEAGQVVRWFGTNTDITERLQLEQRLRQREAQLRELNRTLEERIEERTEALARSGEALLEARNRFFTLFHSSPVPTVLTAPEEGTILDANVAFLHAFKLESTEVIGRKTSAMAAYLQASPAGQERLRTLLQEEGRAAGVELQLQDGAGERLMLVSVEMATLENRPVAVSTLIDITERREAEKQAQELAAELALAQERERKRIAQVLHDEVQQVLVAMQIQLQMAREGDDEMMRTVLSSAGSYVEEVLEMTRSLSGQLSAPAQDSDRLLDSFHWLRDFMARSYDFTVEVEVGEELTMPDPDLRVIVLRLLRELLFNVVKHAGTNQARLSARLEGNALVIQVIDDGRGFDPAILERRSNGSGYGLTGMGNRLGLFGGEFEIDSAPGRGTVITLLIPTDARDK